MALWTLLCVVHSCVDLSRATGGSESNGYHRECSSCAEGSPREIGVFWTVTNPRQWLLWSLWGCATQAWRRKMSTSATITTVGCRFN